MNPTHKFTPAFWCIGFSLLLSACSVSGVRKELGLNRSSPDEFLVVRRAPLEIPEHLKSSLPSPDPGKVRPQEKTPQETARSVLYGTESTNNEQQSLSNADQLFLKKTAPANPYDGDIRADIDAETSKLWDRNKPVAEKLLNIGGDAALPSASVVNAKEEAERLRKNKEDGLSITDGETPSIEE